MSFCQVKNQNFFKLRRTSAFRMLGTKMSPEMVLGTIVPRRIDRESVELYKAFRPTSINAWGALVKYVGPNTSRNDVLWRLPGFGNLNGIESVDHILATLPNTISQEYPRRRRMVEKSRALGKEYGRRWRLWQRTESDGDPMMLPSGPNGLNRIVKNCGQVDWVLVACQQFRVRLYYHWNAFDWALLY